jgi:isocitrate dehydrogenase (NAD+)
LCAGLVGGLGLVPGANLGDPFAVFESVHGSAPDIAGKGIANPLATILSGILMLHHLDLLEPASRVLKAVQQVTNQGEHLTKDLGGRATTKEMADAIIAEMNKHGTD